MPNGFASIAEIRDADGEERAIYRRSTPFGTTAERGLFVVAFSAERDRFDQVLAAIFGPHRGPGARRVRSRRPYWRGPELAGRHGRGPQTTTERLMSNPTDPSDPANYSGYAEPAAAQVPPAAAAYPQQPAYPAPAAGSPVLLTMGDMSITQFDVITPFGSHPLNGSTWYVTDNSTVEEAVPQWAIIAAIVGFFIVCALSLLFLLVKEKKATGSVQVTVQGPGWSHVAQLPPGSGAFTNEQVAYVRNLVAALPAV